jgi:hypothetical protein
MSADPAYGRQPARNAPQGCHPPKLLYFQRLTVLYLFAGISVASSRIANKAPQFGQCLGPSAGISPLHWQRQHASSSISFARYLRGKEAASVIIMLRLSSN